VDEPTHRAGPCLGEVAEWLSEVDREIHAIAMTREYNYYILKFRVNKGLEVSILLYAGSECMEVRGVAVTGCGDSASKASKLGERPEFTVVDVDTGSGCVTVRAPAEPAYRVLRALQLAGLSRDWEIISLEPVEDLVEVEEEWFSVHYASE
jgi:hypothetical protein